MKKTRLKQDRSCSISAARYLQVRASMCLQFMNSEDGSGINGGEIGYKLKGELEKPYADAAWSLSKNTVSKIVETKYGFHIIQMIDRKGDLAKHPAYSYQAKGKTGGV